MLSRTREQLRARVRREAQLNGTTAAYTDENLNHALQEAWNDVWFELVSADEGYGLSTRTLTAVAAGPTLELPPNLLDLRTLRRDVQSGAGGRKPSYSAPQEAARYAAAALTPGDGSGAGLYWVEGPGEEYDAGSAQYVKYQVRLHFVPDLAAGEQVQITYVTQAPTLGDPAAPGDDSTVIDVVMPPVEAAIVALARARIVGRDDNSEYQRAQGALAYALQAFTKVRARRTRDGDHSPDRYLSDTRWVGY